MSGSQKEFEGKDLEEALHLAADTLGIPEPELDYEIVEQGRRGLFGLGAKNVRIRVMPPIEGLDELHGELLGGRPRKPRRKPQREPRRERAPRREREPKRAVAPREKRERQDEDAPPPPPEEVSAVEGTVQEMFGLMGFDIQVQASPAGSGVNIELEGPDHDALTRKDSEVLPAMQFLLNRMSRRTWPGVGRIDLASNGRRTGRDDDVVGLVKEVAQQVSRTGQAKRLHAMNAYERRLVHLTVRKYPGLGSRSEGDGHLKKVRIFKQGKGGGGRRGNRGRRNRRSAPKG